MIRLVIPISRFSKKILQKEYGTGPIRIPRHDILYDQLRCVRHSNYKLSDQYRALLSDTIEIEVYNDLADHILSKNNNTGIFLYRYHKELMYRFVDRSVKFNQNISEAMADFYLEYELDDDDFNLETALRTYRRFAKKTKKSSSSGRVSIVRSIGKQPPTRIVYNFYSEEVLSPVIDEIALLADMPNFQRIKQSLELFFFHNYSNIRQDLLAKRFNLTPRAVSYNIENIKYLIRNYESFRMVYAAALSRYSIKDCLLINSVLVQGGR
jgi:hypothetical protein